MKRFCKCVFLALFLCLIRCGYVNADIDAKLIAWEETEAWKAYYTKDANKFFAHFQKMLLLQFGLSDKDPKNLPIVQQFLVAMTKFGNMAIDSPEESYDLYILSPLTQAYASLKEAVHASWDPAVVAKSDLDWWVARRNSWTDNPEIVGDKIAKLYRILYAKNEDNHFAKAAYLRASAARFRDLSQNVWTISEEDWKLINLMLERSYEELDTGIHSTL